MDVKNKIKELLENNEMQIPFWDCYNDTSMSKEARVNYMANNSILIANEVINVLLQIREESMQVYQSLSTPKKLCSEILNPKIKYWEEVKRKLQNIKDK